MEENRADISDAEPADDSFEVFETESLHCIAKAAACNPLETRSICSEWNVR